MNTFCMKGNEHWFDYLLSALNVFVLFQGNRVTMKLDVSYTDHSHIIGKGGMTIKKVMEETGCHIHFPDSNRSNMNEKSNQVSIAGELDGVEKARARVRVGPCLIRMCWIKPAKCLVRKGCCMYHESVSSEASFLGLWSHSTFWFIL